jgi:hypothetical protein
MDLQKLVNSFGTLTESEITAGVHAIAPEITSYEMATAFLWGLFRKLIDAEKFKSAKMLIEGLGWSQQFKNVVTDIIMSRAAAFRGNGACSAAHYFVGTGA